MIMIILFQVVPEVNVTAEESSNSSSSSHGDGGESGEEVEEEEERGPNISTAAAAAAAAPPPVRPRSPVVIRNLPGPSQVLGDQGNSGTNPLTGQRQRRRGVSGPPTGE